MVDAIVLSGASSAICAMQGPMSTRCIRRLPAGYCCSCCSACRLCCYRYYRTHGISCRHRGVRRFMTTWSGHGRGAGSGLRHFGADPDSWKPLIGKHFLGWLHPHVAAWGTFIKLSSDAFPHPRGNHLCVIGGGSICGDSFIGCCLCCLSCIRGNLTAGAGRGGRS
jgi:hypothetical protein